jgi:hypothetical protein
VSQFPKITNVSGTADFDDGEKSGSETSVNFNG